MRTCIIKAHRAGLFSLINNVITCAHIYDKFEVDWRVSEGCLYGSESDGNIWNHLFDERHPVENPEIVANYPHQLLTYKNAGHLYQCGTLANWRESCEESWYSLGVDPDIVKSAAKFRKSFIVPFPYEDSISVLIRANCHAGEQLDNRNQTLDEYAAAIEKHSGRWDSVFVAGDQQSIAWLSERFPVVYYPDPSRPESRDVDRHIEKQQTIEEAKRCITEVLLMSMGRVFIHPISNMATAALFINPSTESVYLR